MRTKDFKAEIQKAVEIWIIKVVTNLKAKLDIFKIRNENLKN